MKNDTFFKIALAIGLMALNAAFPFSEVQAQGLPTPQVKYTGRENIQDQGKSWTRYFFTVTNQSAYAKELFEPAPELPPCGLNKKAWRGHVEIYNQENNKVLYGYCGKPEGEPLKDLMFTVANDQAQPKAFYVSITDRKTNAKATSKPVAIPPPLMSSVGAAPATPKGQTDLSMREALYFTGTKTETIDLKNDPYAAKGATFNLSTELAKSCVKDVCEFNVGAIGFRSGPMSTALSTYGYISLEDSSGAGNTIYFAPSAASKQLVVPVKLKMGKNRITVTIDPYKKTAETNEGNNSFSVDVIVNRRGNNPNVKN